LDIITITIWLLLNSLVLLQAAYSVLKRLLLDMYLGILLLPELRGIDVAMIGC
jgi:hypothetical protein